MKDMKKLKKKACQKKEEPGIFCGICNGGFGGSNTISVVVVIAAAAVTGGGAEEGGQVTYILVVTTQCKVQSPFHNYSSNVTSCKGSYRDRALL